MNLSINKVLDILNACPSVNMPLITAIVLLVAAITLVIAASIDEQRLFIATLFLCGFFLASAVHVRNYIDNEADLYATISTTIEKVKIQDTPSNILSKGYKNILINNKSCKVYTDENTKYVKDTTNKYVKIAHIKPTVENIWFFNTESVTEANNKELNYAKEIHY